MACTGRYNGATTYEEETVRSVSDEDGRMQEDDEYLGVGHQSLSSLSEPSMTTD